MAFLTLAAFLVQQWQLMRWQSQWNVMKTEVAELDAEAERQVLTSQADALRAQLRAVESRIEGYEKKEKPE